MMGRKIVLWMVSAAIGLWIFGGSAAWAVDKADEPDYSQIENVMEEILPEKMEFSFSQLVSRLVDGDFRGIFDSIKDEILSRMVYEVRSSRRMLIQMVGIICISAVFTNFSMAFSRTFIAETGYYLTYMVLITLLLTSFMTAARMAETLMGNMLKFMSALVPVFCLSVTLTGNIQTGIVYQQAMAAGLTAAEWLISKVILGLIHMYVILSLVNQLAKEDTLSKCAELIKTVAGWSLKTILGLVFGMHLIQGLILPAFDSLKNGWAMRVTSAIPGVGDAMGSAVQTVIGSAVLIKNGIGTAGMLFLVFLFIIPAVKLGMIVLMYQAAQAIVQPVADKRMLECLHCVSDGVMMLLKVQGTVFVLFFLSMAMMTAASGSVFGG